MRLKLFPVLMLLCLLAAGAFVLAYVYAPEPPLSEETATHSAELGFVLLDETDGLFVLAITENSTALRAGFRPGDMLLQSGDIRLTTSMQLDNLLGSAQQNLHILLNREGREMLLELPISKNLANRRRIHYTDFYTNLLDGGD